MGKVKNFAVQIMELAEMLGDPYGFSDETIDYVASEMQISYDDVRAVLHNDIEDPAAYAELAADLDAKHYGTV